MKYLHSRMIFFKLQQSLKHQNMKRFIPFLVVAALLFSLAALVSCDKDNPPVDEFTPGGWLAGQVFAKNGTTPIANANVFVDCNGEIYITQTDRDGRFKLIAPEGPQVLNIQSGYGRIFRTTVDVTVEKYKVTTIPEYDLKLAQAANLAYIAGSYDEIQDVIESLGYTCTAINITDLEDADLIASYGALFINCSAHHGFNEAIWNNLQEYVENGGSLYVSDWAVSSLIGYLTTKDQCDENRHWYYGHSTGTKSCPTRLGGFITTDDLCTQRSGLSGTITGASVINQELADWIGLNTIDINYDLGSWETIQQLSDSWEVLIQDDNMGYGPLAVRTRLDSPADLDMKTKDQSWVTICHIPPGNPANAHTITIALSAWPAHEAHGDQMGPCEGHSGSIIFTTFHNHPDDDIPVEIQKILEYFIINL